MHFPSIFSLSVKLMYTFCIHNTVGKFHRFTALPKKFLFSSTCFAVDRYHIAGIAANI